MKGEEEFEGLLLTPALIRKSETWLDVGEAAAVDQAAVDEWVGVFMPDDQVSMSEWVSFGMKSGILRESVSMVMSSISSSPSVYGSTRAPEAGVAGVGADEGPADVDASLLGEDLFIMRKGDTVDMLSTKTGVGGFLKDESSSSSVLPSSSEHAVL